MAERGFIYNALRYAPIYSLYQRFFGSQKAYYRFVREYLQLKLGDAILDLGCGPGSICDFLPDEVTYNGCDPNEHYIKQATKRFGANMRFWQSGIDVDKGLVLPEGLPPCNIVLSMGVIHHLSDGEAVLLINLAKTVVDKSSSHGAKFIVFDNCLTDHQNRFARWLILNDRGAHARHISWYRDIFNLNFKKVKIDLVHDFYRFPYTNVVIECANPVM